MSEAKEYRISNLSVDKNGWMHVVLSRGDDSVIDDAYIKLVEYSALAAKEAEIEQLKKRISWLESGSIHTCHAECEKPLCVANREIERMKAELKCQQAKLVAASSNPKDKHSNRREVR